MSKQIEQIEYIEPYSTLEVANCCSIIGSLERDHVTDAPGLDEAVYATQVYCNLTLRCSLTEWIQAAFDPEQKNPDESFSARIYRETRGWAPRS